MSAARPAHRASGQSFAIKRSGPAIAASVAALAAAVALGPLLARMVAGLWASPRFGHAPLVWLAAAALAVWRLREARGAGSRVPETSPATALGRLADCLTIGTPPRRWAEAGLWLVALALSAGAIQLGSGWLALTATILLIPAALYSWGGWGLLRPVLPAWAVVWTTLPPPFNSDADLVLKLQGIAAKLASAALDLLGRRHLPEGVTVELPERRYFVEEACSGVNSLYALLAVAAIGLAWGRRSWWRWPIVLSAAVVWAVAANAARVTAAVELSAGLGWKVAEGIGHDILGVITFALAGLLTLSVDALLRFVAPPFEPDADPPDDAAPHAAVAPADPSPARSTLPRVAAWGTAAVAFGLLAGWRLLDAPAVAPAAGLAGAPTTGDLKPVSEDSLPASWNGWERVGFETVTREVDHLDGPFSAIWQFRRGSLTATISMDGPFANGFHDLQTCYTANGWRCTNAVDRTVSIAAPADSSPASKEQAADHGAAGGDTAAGDVITRLDLAQPLGRRGLVLFTSYALDDDANLGADLAARTGSIWVRRFEAFRDRSGPNAGHASLEPAYQVQAYVAAYRPLNEREEEAVEALFHAMRRRLAALPADGSAADGSAADGPSAAAEDEAA